MWEDAQGHSCLWQSLPLHWGGVSLQIRLENSEDGIILGLAICLDCPRRKTAFSLHSCVCWWTSTWRSHSISGFPLFRKIQCFCSWSWAGAQLAPAKPGCQKRHKEEFWPVPLCLKTHTESQILALTQVWNLEDWQTWTWKQSWLIENEDTLLSQVLRWGDKSVGCLIPSCTQNDSSLSVVKEKKIPSLFSQFTINSSICLQGSKWKILSTRS